MDVHSSGGTSSNIVYVGNVDERVDEALLYELMNQAGPVVSVSRFPRETDNLGGPEDAAFDPSNRYAFVQFSNHEDAKYCCLILNNCRVFDLPLKVAPANPSATLHEIVENIKSVQSTSYTTDDAGTVYGIHISNLDPDVDEEKLSEAFRPFGHMVSFPQIFRPDVLEESHESVTNTAIIYYNAKSEAVDAIQAMNGEYYHDRIICVEMSRK